MGIAIITDSTCDFTLDVRKNLSVDIVPLTVNFNGISVKDGYDEKQKRNIYKHMRLGETRLMTSQPSPDEFLNVFRKYKEQGDDVIYIGISSRSSGTLQAAKVARSMCDYNRIYVVDSLQLSHGLQVLVRIACRLRDEGASAQEILAQLQLYIPRVRFLTYVDSLKYLKDGGRVKKFTNHDSGRFHMKTLVSMIDGKFTPTGTVRGRLGAFEKIHEMMQKMKVDEKHPVILTHADSLGTMLSFELFLKSKGYRFNYTYSEIGSVIGSHMGPGTVGIAYIEK